MHRQMKKGEERGSGNPPTNRPDFSAPRKTFAFYRHTDKFLNKECQEREAGI